MSGGGSGDVSTSRTLSQKGCFILVVVVIGFFGVWVFCCCFLTFFFFLKTNVLKGVRSLIQ